MTNYKSIVNKLQKHYSDAENVVIVSDKGKILYSTNKWDVKHDILNVLNSWKNGNAQFVNLCGIKYSILQMEPERFIGTNRNKKGHLIGATTPDGKIYMMAHIKPKAKGWFHMAYPAVARAAVMLKKGSESRFIETEVKSSSRNKIEPIYQSSTSQMTGNQVVTARSIVDPYLKAEIEGFLQWIKNPLGLAGYITNTLQQNDYFRISKLAEIYNRLYSIFYD